MARTPKTQSVTTAEAEAPAQSPAPDRMVPTSLHTITADAPSTTFRGLTLDFATLPPVSVSRLLAYGFSQMLQDAVSGVKAKAETAYGARNGNETESADFVKFCEASGLDPDSTAAIFSQDQFTTAVLQAIFDRKVEALREGKVSIREGGSGSPKLSPLDSEIRRIAIERAKAALRAAGKKLPKTRDELDGVFAKVMASKQAESIRAEATANLAQPAADLTDLALDLD